MEEATVRKVELGGYQTGCSYSWYRHMGHNPISAAFMLIPGKWLMYAMLFVAVLIVVAVACGMVIGGAL